MSLRTLALSTLLAATTTALVSQDGKTGKLPALGFNSWNAFRCDIHENKFLIAAQEMVDLGLKDAGYEYVNIDDCWSLKERDNVTQRIIPDPERFPEGIAGTAEKVHALGLKLGIYSDAGTLTCAGYPGSLGYEAVDAQTWEEWGVDYLKYDNCNVPANWTDVYQYWPEYWYGTYENQTGGTPAPAGYDFSKSLSAERYHRMRDALRAHEGESSILYSLCNWGHAHVERWGNETGQSWRMWGDIVPQWDQQLDWSWGFMPIVNHGIFFLEWSGFWGHNDLDMLEVGNGNLTAEETRTHFGLWAALKSPLLIGTPLDAITEADLAVLKNWEILAFNQDNAWGAPALPYKWGINPAWTWNQTHPAEYYSGGSTRGIHAFIVNTLDHTVSKAANFAEIPGLDAKKTYEVRDMWTHKKLGSYKKKFEFKLKAHDTAALLFTEKGGKHPHPGNLPLPDIYKGKPKRWVQPELKK
ncbi:glycoside hydrolase superfamily [Tricharina praecox]|uniref:glycoside hydrolase superfamily n=1 Tax=Tricharina praecox TaxID=43433 RepID=UPI00221EA610|nr:glycoside hydrolase superfamily [Tricharina praecox]KAI5852379.1 glycoside hydrolase superfamily [Tricharina praecox]